MCPTSRIGRVACSRFVELAVRCRNDNAVDLAIGRVVDLGGRQEPVWLALVCNASDESTQAARGCIAADPLHWHGSCLKQRRRLGIDWRKLAGVVGAMEVLVGLIVLVLDIVAILSIVGSGASVEKKVLWIALVLLLPVIGMVLYFLLGRRV